MVEIENKDERGDLQKKKKEAVQVTESIGWSLKKMQLIYSSFDGELAHL